MHNCVTLELSDIEPENTKLLFSTKTSGEICHEIEEYITKQIGAQFPWDSVKGEIYSIRFIHMNRYDWKGHFITWGQDAKDINMSDFTDGDNVLSLFINNKEVKMEEL